MLRAGHIKAISNCSTLELAREVKQRLLMTAKITSSAEAVETAETAKGIQESIYVQTAKIVFFIIHW